LNSSTTTTPKSSLSTITSILVSSNEEAITTEEEESTTILSTTTEGIKTTQTTTKDAPSFNNFMKNLGIATGIVAFISSVIAFFYKKKNRPITVTSSSNRDKDVEMSLLKKE
jgi:mannitol-1-phosphate/altronate dehydrogenase